MWVAGLKYITRGGDTALIYATDANGSYPINGRILGRQADHPTSWNNKGRWSGTQNQDHKDHEFDLTGLVLQMQISND